jgi:hypothetical protein
MLWISWLAEELSASQRGLISTFPVPWSPRVGVFCLTPEPTSPWTTPSPPRSHHRVGSESRWNTFHFLIQKWVGWQRSCRQMDVSSVYTAQRDNRHATARPFLHFRWVTEKLLICGPRALQWVHVSGLFCVMLSESFHTGRQVSLIVLTGTGASLQYKYHTRLSLSWLGLFSSEYSAFTPVPFGTI